MAESSCPGSVASAAMASTLRAPAARHSLARASTSARVRATTATCAPSRAMARAAAPPRPRPAPINRTHFSVSSRSIPLLYFAEDIHGSSRLRDAASSRGGRSRRDELRISRAGGPARNGLVRARVEWRRQLRSADVGSRSILVPDEQPGHRGVGPVPVPAQLAIRWRQCPQRRVRAGGGVRDPAGRAHRVLSPGGDGVLLAVPFAREFDPPHLHRRLRAAALHPRAALLHRAWPRARRRCRELVCRADAGRLHHGDRRVPLKGKAPRVSPTGPRVFIHFWDGAYYIPIPWPPGAPDSSLSFGRLATIASVVSISEATDAEFCSANRDTLVGSITPAWSRSSY